MRKKCIQQISDAVAGETGLSRFQSVTSHGDRRIVRFQMRSGDTFDVPVPVILTWFDGYEDEQPGAILREVSVDDLEMIDAACWVEGRIARVSLNDGRILDVPWDTLLMACEPRFEHYGGLTAASKKLTKRLARNYGSFKVSEKNDAS